MTEDKFQTEGERLAEQLKNLQSPNGIIQWMQKHLTKITYQYQGVSSFQHRTEADLVSTKRELVKEDQDLKDRCERLEKELTEANAAIGELQIRMDKMAEWAAKQTKRIDP